MSKKGTDTVSLVWCDNGMVDGKFAQGISDILIKSGVKFETTLRSYGNQIGRQREQSINYWYDNNLSDWLLWVDSDIVITPEIFKRLWQKKDALTRPIITGVYFTTNTPEEPLMVPMPTIFKFVEGEEGFSLERVHPMPKDSFIKVDGAGMGLVLMHRNVVTKIRKEMPETTLFQELGTGERFIGEDIYFFALCNQVGIPLWCDTGAVAPHMKKFSFDIHYYNAMHGSLDAEKER
jgi:glycosyltransferase involved in cell wall biosynthesis